MSWNTGLFFSHLNENVDEYIYDATLAVFARAKAEGILSLNGDELKLCYVDISAKDPGKRPAKFESTKDNKAFYFVFKRAK